MRIMRELFQLTERETPRLGDSFVSKYSKDGKKYILWYVDNYMYRLTKSAQNAEGAFDNVELYPDSSYEDVVDDLKKKGYEKMGIGEAEEAPHFPHLNEDVTVQVGDTVKLKPALDKKAIDWCPEGRENNATAVVKATFDPEIKGGVYLDRDLRGVKYWNVEDLVVVQRKGGMSAAGKKADMEQSDREYIAQRQAREKQKFERERMSLKRDKS